MWWRSVVATAIACLGADEGIHGGLRLADCGGLWGVVDPWWWGSALPSEAVEFFGGRWWVRAGSRCGAVAPGEKP